MFEDSPSPLALWLYVTAQHYTTRFCQVLHRLRSNYPIPPGLGGPTVKLLLNAALPLVVR